MGIDDYEVAGSPIARDNTQLFRINRAAAQAATGVDPSADASPPADIFIPIVNLGISFRADGVQVNDSYFSRDGMLRAVALLALALFCLWLLSLILRLVFRRPPKFDLWQPPYALNNWQDPNSTIGRRQAGSFMRRTASSPLRALPSKLQLSSACWISADLCLAAGRSQRCARSSMTFTGASTEPK